VNEKAKCICLQRRCNRRSTKPSGCISNYILGILLSTTNKMQRYTIFIIVNALHISDGSSTHHQELKDCTHSIWYVPAVAASKPGTYQMLCVQFLIS